MSDIHKLNDANETKVFLEVLKDATTEAVLTKYEGYNLDFVQGMSAESSVRFLINSILDQVKKYDDNLRYVACFSGDGDQLSQWIRYADDGKGVALGFDIALLRKIAAMDSDLEFQEVQYIDSNTIHKNPIVEKYTKKIMDSLIYYVAKNETDELLSNVCYLPYFSGGWCDDLIDDSIFYKDSSFVSENEWRFVLKDEGFEKSGDNWMEYYNWEEKPPNNIMGQLFPKGMQFRSTGNNIVSYLDLCFSDYLDDGVFNDIYRPEL